MADLQCPYCRSENVRTENRLRSPRTSSVQNSVGQWRIGCGVSLVVIAVLVGGISLLIRNYWLGAETGTAAMQIALLAFVFAAAVLAMTIFFSRWVPFQRHTCQECERVWVSESRQNSAEQLENSA